jgi:hypothetical protein
MAGKGQIMTISRWVATVFVGAVLVAGLGRAQAAAESPSTLLEKGLYLEQTAGDLDAAMVIYKQIADGDQANRPLAAQAQYRLGLCQLKKKQSDAAADSFRKVISLYPDQTGLVAQAQQSLGELGVGAHGTAGAPPKPARPGVIHTNPPTLADDVDPSLAKITVTFNYPMMDRSWSWTGSGELYPKTTGSPSYDTSRRTCTLPVQLEPGKVYRIGINSKSFKNFKTAAGAPVPWYMIVFATRSADGKSTPIPQDLQQQARAINQISDAQVGTSQQGPPKVVRSVPKALADNVTASLDKITVTFNRPMQDGNWSWTGGGDTYPETLGKPSYDVTKRTCTLPVKLESGKVYWVGINSPSHQNFRATDGTPAARHVILFATESADGKPTPIPQDLLDAAREINGQAVATDPAGSAARSHAAVASAAGAAQDFWSALVVGRLDDARKMSVPAYIESHKGGYERIRETADLAGSRVVEVTAGTTKAIAITSELPARQGDRKIAIGISLVRFDDGWLVRDLDALPDDTWRAKFREEFRKAAPEATTVQVHQVEPGAAGADLERQQAIEQVFADPEPIVSIANKIFEAIRSADYDRWINGEGWGSFPMVRYYQTYQWYDALVPWICKTFKADPIKDVALGQVVKNEDGLPAIPYKLTLASGKVMEGVLPFNYKDGDWYARWGLDWHLGNRMRLTEARKTTPPAGPAKIEARAIGKPVSAFAAGDLSTPESAAANYNRASGSMDAEALAAVSLAPVDAAAMKRAFERNQADMEVYNKAQLTATIIQVLTYRDGVAKVITKLNFPPGVGRHPFSGRMFGLFNGQWKNMGEDRYPTPGAARAAFEKAKDAIWDDYMQMVEGQNGSGGGTTGVNVPLVDASSPEATIRGFMKAAVAGDVDRAMAYRLPGSRDLQDTRRAQLSRELPDDPGTRLFVAIDPEAPVEIINVERQADTAVVVWRVKLAKPWIMQEEGQSRTVSAGETFDLKGNLKKVGDAWLIDSI